MFSRHNIALLGRHNDSVFCGQETVLLGLSINQRIEEFTLALCDDYPYCTSVFKWYKEFQRRNFIGKKCSKTETPRASVTVENVTDGLNVQAI